jgi:hypothetical protein
MNLVNAWVINKICFDVSLKHLRFLWWLGIVENVCSSIRVYVLRWCRLPCRRVVFPRYAIKWTCSSTSHSSWSLHVISAMHLGMSTYTFASYRITRSNSGSSSWGAERAARGARVGGARSRRGGRWGSSRVPRPPPKLFRKRQAPEHFSPSLQIFY